MTKKNHLETRTIRIGKKRILVDFVSGPSLFTDEQIQQISNLLQKYHRKGYIPPPGFDPIQKIIFSTEFFFAYRAKKIEEKNRKVRLKKAREAAMRFYEAIIEMDEGALNCLGLDLDWQEKIEEELLTLSNKALIWEKEHPTSHRRYELETRIYFSDLILIYEKVTGQKAGTKGRFFNLVEYILTCIDPEQKIIWRTEQALRARIVQAKDYLIQQGRKRQKKTS